MLFRSQNFYQIFEVILKSAWDRVTSTNDFSVCDLVDSTLDVGDEIQINVPQNEFFNTLISIRSMIPDLTNGFTIGDAKDYILPFKDKYPILNVRKPISKQQLLILQFSVFVLGWLVIQVKSYNDNTNYDFIKNVLSLLQNQQQTVTNQEQDEGFDNTLKASS